MDGGNERNRSWTQGPEPSSLACKRIYLDESKRKKSVAKYLHTVSLGFFFKKKRKTDSWTAIWQVSLSVCHCEGRVMTRILLFFWTGRSLQPPESGAIRNLSFFFFAAAKPKREAAWAPGGAARRGQRPLKPVWPVLCPRGHAFQSLSFPVPRWLSRGPPQHRSSNRNEALIRSHATPRQFLQLAERARHVGDGSRPPYARSDRPASWTASLLDRASMLSAAVHRRRQHCDVDHGDFVARACFVETPQISRTRKWTCWLLPAAEQSSLVRAVVDDQRSCSAAQWTS